jgi:hypothetical protein
VEAPTNLAQLGLRADPPESVGPVVLGSVGGALARTISSGAGRPRQPLLVDPSCLHALVSRGIHKGPGCSTTAPPVWAERSIAVDEAAQIAGAIFGLLGSVALAVSVTVLVRKLPKFIEFPGYKDARLRNLGWGLFALGLGFWVITVVGFLTLHLGLLVWSLPAGLVLMVIGTVVQSHGLRPHQATPGRTDGSRSTNPQGRN